jgi:hypothetical protein
MSNPLELLGFGFIVLPASAPIPHVCFRCVLFRYVLFGMLTTLQAAGI